MRRVLVAMGIVLGLEVACSGSSETNLTSAPDAGADAESPYTLDNVCDRITPLTCELREPCCGAEFERGGCLAQARRECEANVAEVRAGRQSFHPERIPECIPKYRTLFASCTLTFDLLQKSARDIAGCEAFTGQGASGSACERTAQCQPGAAGEIVGCDNDTKKCKTTEIVAEGAACSFADGLGVICDDGLYCDVDFSKEPASGVCKKKTSLGVACDKDKKPYPLECGLGNYCATATGVCTIGKAGGAACENDLECASVKCEKGGGIVAGNCKPAQSLSKPEECKGP